MMLTSNEVRQVIENVLGENLADEELVVELAADIVAALEQEGAWDIDVESEDALENGMSLRRSP